MDDECCVMEEKTLLGCFRSVSERDGSSLEDRYSNREDDLRNPEEIGSWLPDELRREVIRGLARTRRASAYPVIDWLKEIRRSCDLYEAGGRPIEEERCESESGDSVSEISSEKCDTSESNTERTTSVRNSWRTDEPGRPCEGVRNYFRFEAKPTVSPRLPRDPILCPDDHLVLENCERCLLEHREETGSLDYTGLSEFDDTRMSLEDELTSEPIFQLFDTTFGSFDSLNECPPATWLDLDIRDDEEPPDHEKFIRTEYRARKGSASSDIVAWKKCLLDAYLDEEETTGQWFSSSDAEGKIYFFEENSNESSWVLPSLEKLRPVSRDGESTERADPERATSEKDETGSGRFNLQVNDPSTVVTKSTKKNPAGDWPHLCDGNNMLVLKEGVINRTKITENGKKLRKNWSTSYAVLTELFLLFFKDAKTFAMMKTSQSSMAKPDISVDLNGALVEPGERASSRKNVYMISTVLGLQVLVQSDNTTVATEWFQEIHGAIRKLPFGFKSQTKALPIPVDGRSNITGKQPNDTNHQDDTKKTTKVSRSRSMKTVKRLDDSLEDLSGSVAERQTKIKAKLRRFFLRRPAVELLVKNGIYKDEPAFGSYLSDVCPPDPPRVPIFVKTCIQVLESNEENMKTDGLYRASGNLSQIQKIRLQVDQYKLEVLAQEEDVHVLAGALKLFFRELKEPLIPSSFFKEAVNASMLKKTSTKIQCFREIVKSLPPPNYDTLQYLLKHLLRVTSYQEFNRMHIPNLAIVFGPTLMWPAEESANMALDFMQQNLVIECLLSEYNKIFK